MDSFRLNMRAGYGPNQPPSPPPVTPAAMWTDVADWQAYLHSRGYPATNPPNDMFSAVDTNATIKFQRWAMANGYPEIVPNGTVDINTYNAAVANGMPPYPTVPS